MGNELRNPSRVFEGDIPASEDIPVCCENNKGLLNYKKGD
jgi:hypothetical protein